VPRAPLVRKVMGWRRSAGGSRMAVAVGDRLFAIDAIVGPYSMRGKEICRRSMG